MDTRVRNFLYDKAVGLLEVWKGRPPLKTLGDIESGLLNATQPPLVERESKHGPDHERCESTPDNGPQDTLPALARLNDRNISRHSQFTDEPARFIVVNDGSKDCLALLVTETFVAKSRDLYEDSHHLLGKRGPLQQVRQDTRNVEASLGLVRESLEMAESQEQADELRKIAQKRDIELIDARQRKTEIEEGAEILESRVAASRAYTQWAIETAMEEVNLLEPHRPLTPFTAVDPESDESTIEAHNETQMEYTENDSGGQNAVQDADVPTQQPVIPANNAAIPAEVPADEDSIRQAAWEDYNDKLATFHKVQAIFDDRQQAYETNLAKFQNGVRAGIYNMSRSEFDRNRFRHGQKITRALIEAEEAFDAAKAYAQAVDAAGSEYEQTNHFGHYEESMPESQMTSHNASRDFSDIHTWITSIAETSDPNDFESVEMDDWDVKETDQTDSISQIDFDEYRKPIDQWQYECALARGDGPEEYYLGPVNIEFLERRHSFSLSRSGT